MTKVAVLLATYNGARFIEPQIRSLKENATPFTLHWLDDHSTDNTREAVREAALHSGIQLTAWHQPQRLGVPAAFFRLLESVDADIYLFCDQDDIWQHGKIDATVANLRPDVARPTLCFSDPLMFGNDEPAKLRPLSDVLRYAKRPKALQESRLFLSACACGNTLGFTRALRELFMGHKDIAHAYARMHDSWLYLIAAASGTVRPLSNAPTTLYRQHANNVSGGLPGLRRNKPSGMWRLQHRVRRSTSRHAQGFILAAPTLPPGPKLERVLSIARLIGTLERRQSPLALARLAYRRAMWPNWRDTLWLTLACLWTDAKS
jgi:rhamnosyltransferase